jgi:hypothetical protein
MCPHTAICVRMNLNMYPHNAVCVLVLLYVSAYYFLMCPPIALCVSSYYQLVLIVPHSCLVILHMPPHTTMCPHTTHATTGASHTPHTTMHVSSCHSHYYICALIQLTLLHMPPHTAHTSPRCRLSQRCAAASTRAKRTPSSSSTRAARSVLHFLALPLLGFRV